MNESSSTSSDEDSVGDCIKSNKENFEKVELNIGNAYISLMNGDVKALQLVLDAIKEKVSLLKEGNAKVTQEYHYEKGNAESERRARFQLHNEIEELGLTRVLDMASELEDRENAYHELKSIANHNESLVESSEVEMKKLKQQHKEELEDEMGKKDDQFHDVANMNIDLNGVIHELRQKLTLAEEYINDLELQIPDHPPQSDDDMDDEPIIDLV